MSLIELSSNCTSQHRCAVKQAGAAGYIHGIFRAAAITDCTKCCCSITYWDCSMLCCKIPWCSFANCWMSNRQQDWTSLASGHVNCHAAANISQHTLLSCAAICVFDLWQAARWRHTSYLNRLRLLLSICGRSMCHNLTKACGTRPALSASALTGSIHIFVRNCQ